MIKESIVKEQTLKYFKGNELLTNIWMSKYALRDKSKNLLEQSPLEMYKRIAKEFSRIEEKYPNPISYKEIHRLLKEQYILPGGSLLYGIGNNYSISSLGNCFVIGNNADSYGGICHTDQEQVQLMKRRAGVGHDLSHIRPNGSLVTNAAGSSTGSVSFMPRYSNSTREVGQDGRRGALMLSEDINHPDSEAFITSKDDLTKITGANISVKVDDEFMQRRLKMDAYKERGLWKKLVHQAWKTAEPGVLFWDTILREDIPSCYGKEWIPTSTNPCGEIPLCPYDSCRLLSVNLTKFVKNPFTDKAEFDWEKFKRVTYIAQKLMDDIIDLEEEKINQILEKIETDPEDEKIKQIEKDLWLKIKQKLLSGRRTGLSGIGLADCLAARNIPYGSDDSINIANDIYSNLAITAYKSSIDMAKDRGAFPIWDKSKEENNSFITRIEDEIVEEELQDCFIGGYFEKYLSTGRRNIALLTIPPSGTISQLAEISSGIEPVYMLSYKRRRKVEPDNPNISFVDKNGDCWEEYNVLHPKFKEWLDTQWIIHKSFESKKDIITESLTENISVDWDNPKHRALFELVNPYRDSTAYELNPIDRVKMQGAIQKWVDHSISSTINLPKEATEEDVANIYMEAWKQGLKGITIYRDGCRDGVLLSQKDTKFVTNNAPKRPKYVPCDIFTPTTHGQQYVVAVGIVDEQPYEIFAFKFDGKFNLDKGYIKKVNRGRYDIVTLDKETYSEDITGEMSQIEEDRTRLISWGLRHGGGIKFLVEQLGKAKGNGFQSFSRVIARTLKRYIEDNDTVTGATCSECGSSELIYKEGCIECISCGNAKCG